MTALAVVSAMSGAAQAEPDTATEKMESHVDTAKPTSDGTVHPGGEAAKPREQWFAPCPPDKKITKSGDCQSMNAGDASAHNDTPKQ
ncbi:MAG: hypothetical protein K0U74_16820 [Alphaproteobacteria bacterium]|nr:hypothetical protein [Alphaproteobacteria bacterium]